MQEWMTVCRYNQARSVISAATLRHFYPENKIESAGVEARENSGVPATVTQIAQMWGLFEYDRTSTTFKSAEIQGSKKRFLAADTFVQDKLNSLMKDHQIDNLVNLADIKAMEPVDPSGMDIDSLALELAKVVVLTLRWAALQMNSSSEIHGVLAEKEIEFKTILESYAKEDTVFIDSNLARPYSSIWAKEKTPIIFNPRNLDKFDFSQLSSGRHYILQSGYEIDDHERIYLSRKWLEFLEKLSVKTKVVIVADVSKESSMPKPASVLALSHTKSTKSF